MNSWLAFVILPRCLVAGVSPIENEPVLERLKPFGNFELLFCSTVCCRLNDSRFSPLRSTSPSFLCSRRESYRRNMTGVMASPLPLYCTTTFDGMHGSTATDALFRFSCPITGVALFEMFPRRLMFVILDPSEMSSLFVARL